MSNLDYAPHQNHVLTQLPHVEGGDTVTIRDFRQLRELELAVTWPGPAYQALLSSITSTELRKVIFPVWHVYDWGIFTQQSALIDKELCGLVHRLHTRGYRCTLEVELRLAEVGGGHGWYDFISLFPEFRERGVVTVVDAAAPRDRVLHSSA